MKPMEKTFFSHHMLELIVTGLITGATGIFIVAAGWTIWKFLMEIFCENWPEWLSLCGLR